MSKYTQEQLKGMSDIGINLAIVEIFKPEDYEMYRDVPNFMKHHNYCSDDALAFRLMIENDIRIFRSVDSFKAYSRGFDDYSYTCSFNPSPNRAIAETVLLMQPDTKESDNG